MNDAESGKSELETNRLLKDLVMETKTPEVPLFPGGASSGMGSSAGGEVRSSRENPFYGKALREAQYSLKLGDIINGAG